MTGSPHWAASWQTGRLSGVILDMDRQPVQGIISFTPDVTGPILAAGSTTIAIPSTTVVELGGDGSFEAVLPAGDDPDITPTGWTYMCRVETTSTRLDGVWRTGFPVLVSVGADVPLTAAIPQASATGTPVTRGESAYEGAVRNGFTGMTEAGFYAALAAAATGGGGAPVSHSHVPGDIIGLDAWLFGVLDTKYGSGGPVPAHQHDTDDLTSGTVSGDRLPGKVVSIWDETVDGPFPSTRPPGRWLWVGTSTPPAEQPADLRWQG